MDKKLLINGFSTRAFRNTADQDYILARLAYRNGLLNQFHWQSLQAIEKYMKAIFLYNRIDAKKMRHDLNEGLKIVEKLPFEIKLSEQSLAFIHHINNHGENRYLLDSYSVLGMKLNELDLTVWELRRYCRVLIDKAVPEGEEYKKMIEDSLNQVEKSDSKTPSSVKISDGFLEKVIQDKEHPSRKALIWQNLYFGSKFRQKVRQSNSFNSVNSPLYLNPEILEELEQLIYIPKERIEVYKNHAIEKSRKNVN